MNSSILGTTMLEPKQITLEYLRSELIGKDTMIPTPFGSRRLTYADYVASGRALGFLEKHLHDQALTTYANTHTEDSFTGARSTHFAHEAAEYVKGCMNANAEFKIVFAGSGSTGAIKRLQEILGLAISSPLRQRMLEIMKPEERPVVFVGPYEHHSNEVSWRESLAEVIEIPLCPKGQIDLDALREALTAPEFRNRKKIGSFSAASNVTGLLSDTRAIARLLHAHGALAFFDFAAAAPYVKIDMRPGKADQLDAIFLSPHKFVGGPDTPGVLVFHESIYKLSSPSTAGGGTVTYVSSSEHHFTSDIEAREDAGTPAIVQKMRTAMAFWVKEQIGVDVIEAQEKSFISRAIARLRSNPNVQILGNLEAPRLAVFSFLIRCEGQYLHPRFVVRLLNDLFGIQSRGGCACAGPYGHALLNIDLEHSQRYMHSIQAGWEGIKPGWTRLNFNSFISENEFEFLLEAIEFVAEHGAKFLSLYELDWHSGAWKHMADQAHPSLFDQPALATDKNTEPDFAGYLGFARTLANQLETRAQPVPPEMIPAELEAELVYFRV
jgi:selenocysteine lyase/cysteine desulfurase